MEVLASEKHVTILNHGKGVRQEKEMDDPVQVGGTCGSCAGLGMTRGWAWRRVMDTWVMGTCRGGPATGLAAAPASKVARGENAASGNLLIHDEDKLPVALEPAGRVR